MVPYTLLLRTCISGTIGICTIDFKITYILDNSSIFMCVATIKIIQSTNKISKCCKFLNAVLCKLQCKLLAYIRVRFWYFVLSNSCFYVVAWKIRSKTLIFYCCALVNPKSQDGIWLRQLVSVIRTIRYTRPNQNNFVAYCRFIMYRNTFRSHTSWE